jgi:quercetin dioxygenase-like cupin family protein
MSGIELRKMIDYSAGGITTKVISKDAKSNVTLFSMAAGTDISEHTSGRDAYVYVIEGEGTFVLDGKNIIMKEGVFFSMPKNSPHELKAEKDTAFLLVLY